MKAVIYCRKSSESEDRQVMSLDAQEHELRKLAEREGIDVVSVLRESMSAKAPGRPVFASMMHMLNQGTADAIICWKLDRLARNPIDGGSISWMLQTKGIKAIKTPERTYHPSDNVLLMYVELGMSNQYVRDLSQNVKRGNREKLRRGEWPNHAPYGYYNDKATKTLAIQQEQAKIVRKIYEMYATGNYSFSQLASRFQLRKNRVENILKRTIYFGLMERDGEFFPGKHKPLITQELYEKAQEVKMAVNAHRPKATKKLFPYRGFLKCADCGCQLTASRKKKIYDYYYCTNGKFICDQHKSYLREYQIDEFFIEALRAIKFDAELIEIMYQAAFEKLKFDQHELKERLHEVGLKLTNTTRQQRKLLQAYVSEKIEEELYTEEAARLKKEKHQFEKETKEIEQELAKQHSTLELTKKVFLDSNKAISEYKTAQNMKKRKVVQNILWNLEIKDKKALKINYKSPYDVLAKAPKSGDLATLLPD